jgi:hypothetical protein
LAVATCLWKGIFRFLTRVSTRVSANMTVFGMSLWIRLRSALTASANLRSRVQAVCGRLVQAVCGRLAHSVHFLCRWDVSSISAGRAGG